MEQRKYISILGMIGAPLRGHPKIGSFYSPSYVSYAGFATPEGTWWMRLIHRLGANCWSTTPLPAPTSAAQGTMPPACPGGSAAWPRRRRPRTWSWCAPASTTWPTGWTWGLPPGLPGDGPKAGGPVPRRPNLGGDHHRGQALPGPLVLGPRHPGGPGGLQ